jgi:hypothetical protein
VGLRLVVSSVLAPPVASDPNMLSPWWPRGADGSGQAVQRSLPSASLPGRQGGNLTGQGKAQVRFAKT